MRQIIDFLYYSCLFRNYTESEALLKISCQEASEFQSSWCHISLIAITTRERIVQKHLRAHSISITVSLQNNSVNLLTQAMCAIHAVDVAIVSCKLFFHLVTPHIDGGDFFTGSNF